MADIHIRSSELSSRIQGPEGPAVAAYTTGQIATFFGQPPLLCYPFIFHGRGGELFRLKIVQMLVTVLTLGIGYPWTRAATLRYLHGQTECAGSRFSFHGTGGPMLVSMLSTMALWGAVATCGVLAAVVPHLALKIVAGVGGCALIIAVVPLLIHNSFRYRISMTAWRGIRMSYHGKPGRLYRIVFTALPLLVVTLGLYAPCLRIRLRRYLIGSIRIGTAAFTFRGEEAAFFRISMRGVVLTVLTLGVYGFWYCSNRFNYLMGSIGLEQEGTGTRLQAFMTARDLFQTWIANVALTIFTLGFGLPWVQVSALRCILENLCLEGELQLDTLDA